MQSHVSSGDVQKNGCGALLNLSVNGKNKVAIAAAGGIDAILLAMRSHVSNADVQKYGCGAFLNLGENGNNRVVIATAGGIGAILGYAKACVKCLCSIIWLWGTTKLGCELQKQGGYCCSRWNQ